MTSGKALRARTERQTRWKWRSISTINRRSYCPDDGREINWKEAAASSGIGTLHSSARRVVVVFSTWKINATGDGQASTRPWTLSSPSPLSPPSFPFQQETSPRREAPIDARCRREESPSSQQPQQQQQLLLRREADSTAGTCFTETLNERKKATAGDADTQQKANAIKQSIRFFKAA